MSYNQVLNNGLLKAAPLRYAPFGKRLAQRYTKKEKQKIKKTWVLGDSQWSK